MAKKQPKYDNLEWQKGVLGVDPKLVDNNPKTTDALVAKLMREGVKDDMPLQSQVNVMRNVMGIEEIEIQASLLKQINKKLS